VALKEQYYLVSEPGAPHATPVRTANQPKSVATTMIQDNNVCRRDFPRDFFFRSAAELQAAQYEQYTPENTSYTFIVARDNEHLKDARAAINVIFSFTPPHSSTCGVPIVASKPYLTYHLLLPRAQEQLNSPAELSALGT